MNILIHNTLGTGPTYPRFDLTITKGSCSGNTVISSDGGPRSPRGQQALPLLYSTWQSNIGSCSPRGQQALPLLHSTWQSNRGSCGGCQSSKVSDTVWWSGSQATVNIQRSWSFG